jgi:hypothetical protein
MPKNESQRPQRNPGRNARAKPLELDVEENRGYGDERYGERDERCQQLDEGPAPEDAEEGVARGERSPPRPRDEAARGG